jgi:hypothetical protein
MITSACCTLHNFCQLQGMLEPMVRVVQAQRDPFVGFVGMCISGPQEGEKVKADGEEMQNALLNHGYNIILKNRFTFCCFM